MSLVDHEQGKEQRSCVLREREEGRRIPRETSATGHRSVHSAMLPTPTRSLRLVSPLPLVLHLLVAGIIVYLPIFEATPTIESTDGMNDISCSGRADGYYADTTTYENSFFRCKDSRVVEQAKCERGARYDPPSRQCTSVPAIETICHPTTEGFYTTPGTLCRGYYTCRNGSREDFTCPVDAYFDMKSQFCVRSGGVCYELVCFGRVNGRYADTTHGCRRSYMCEGGVLQSLQSCPAGTLFNGITCEPSKRVKCQPPERSAVVVRILPTDPCSDQPDGYQPQQDESCRGYVLCHSGQTIAKLRCAPGHHFNGDKCAPAKNTTCVSYCAGKPDGFASDLRRQCRGYVNCRNGKVEEEFSCRDGLLFNGKSCVPALLYQCPIQAKKDECSILPDGYHLDYLTNCREYFYCHQGQILLRSTCQGNYVWNGSDCVPSSEFLCQDPELWPGCDGVENGLYPDHSKDSQCKFYHYCSAGKRVRLSCPDGFLFDGKSCVKSKTYKCPKLGLDCANKIDGYYKDGISGCRSYFYCSDGQKVTYVCPENLVFNGSECVEPHLYNCSTKSTICKNKTNGYHADVVSGCHKYVYCLQGVEITSFSCPENNIFDGIKCVPLKRDNCPEAQNCDSVQNGLYAEPDSQCTKYFKCVDKKRTKTFTCREGKIFNGVKCVNYICPRKSEQLQRRDDCVGKMGFFQDYKSSCNKYYFCINGVKTTLSCSTGQVFNGELCTSQKNYTCPSHD